MFFIQLSVKLGELFENAVHGKTPLATHVAWLVNNTSYSYHP